MKISVVTVCRNSAPTIAYTLESFFRQDHQEKELIIVDGISTDMTLSIIDSFRSEDMIVISEADDGVYDAMNKGLAVFSGAAVGFLNSDDRFTDSNVLSEISDALHRTDVVYGSLNFVADHDSRRIVRRWRGVDYWPGAFRDGWMPAHPTFYVRRDVIEAVGVFETSFEIAADYDFMLRVLEVHKFRSKMISRALVDMRYGGTSTSGLLSYLSGNFHSYRARRQRLGVGWYDPALVWKPLRKLSQFWP